MNNFDPNTFQMMMNNMNNMGMNMNNMNNMNMNNNFNPMMMNNNPMMMNMMNNPMMMNMMNNPMMMMMMMNMMNGGNMGGNMGNVGNVNIESNNPNDWNIIFEKKNGAQIINIRISPDSTVQNAINIYKLKTNTQEKDDEIKFIYNGKNLNYGLKISESGLINGAKITVISTKDVEGAEF